MSRFEWFIARRYLFSFERRALVSLITLISVAGVAVGVAALIVVIGVMEGADGLIFKKIVELYPHVRVRATQDHTAQQDQALVEQLRQLPGVVLAEPVLSRQVFVQPVDRGPTRQQGLLLIGADRVGPGTLYPSLKTISKPKVTTLAPRQILMGYPVAYHLQTPTGTTVQVTSTNPVATALYPVLKTMKFTVMDYARSGLYDFDANTAFVQPQMLRELFHTDQLFDYVHIQLKDPFMAQKVVRDLQLPEGYVATSWADENGEFFGALKLEKLGLFIILLLVILVASFNIIGTLILMVMDKTREVGLLRAVGASQGQVARVFLYDGIMIGLVGTALGVGVGLVLCWLIPMIKIDMPAVVFFDYLPVKVNPLTVGLIVFCSMAICTLAAMFPARQAARLHPVHALRQE